ncbi:MAG: hypothetical protein ACFFD4_34325 [Candidatus Odinarchaeota archaeon]
MNDFKFFKAVFLRVNALALLFAASRTSTGGLTPLSTSKNRGFLLVRGNIEKRVIV